MAGIIGWIIILWIIAVSIKSNKKKTETAADNRTGMPVEKPQTRERIEKTLKKGYQAVTEQAQRYASVSNQEELRRRLMEKYEGYTQKKPDILERASANVAEDFEEKPIAQPVKKKEKQNGTCESSVIERTSQLQGVQQVMEKAPQNQIVQEKRVLTQVDFREIYDLPQIPQESELMKMVSDILAKGMDTEPAFSRDFVAEGLDMINKAL